jgi:hypothetical protein
LRLDGLRSGQGESLCLIAPVVTFAAHVIERRLQILRGMLNPNPSDDALLDLRPRFELLRRRGVGTSQYVRIAGYFDFSARRAKSARPLETRPVVLCGKYLILEIC